MNVYVKEPKEKVSACVIWMHGLGANAENMMNITEVFPELPVRHVFIEAPIRPVTLNNHLPMRAWYDIVGLTLFDREDSEGILQSEHLINEVITGEMKKGLSSQQIFLAGFSQGGAMALFTALRSQVALGGVMALSAYLPVKSLCEKAMFCKMPVFLAIGNNDPIVLPSWSRMSYEWLISNKFLNVSWHAYPMEHQICIEEIRDLAQWLNVQISMITCDESKL